MCVPPASSQLDAPAGLSRGRRGRVAGSNTPIRGPYAGRVALSARARGSAYTHKIFAQRRRPRSGRRQGGRLRAPASGPSSAAAEHHFPRRQASTWSVGSQCWPRLRAAKCVRVDCAAAVSGPRFALVAAASACEPRSAPARRVSRSLARSTSHTPPSPPFERAAASRAKRPRSGTRGARRRRRTSRAERAGSQPRGARCSQPRGARCLPARRAQHRALLSRLPLRSAPNALAPQALTRGTARPSRTPSSTSTSSRGRVRAAGKRDGS